MLSITVKLLSQNFVAYPDAMYRFMIMKNSYKIWVVSELPGSYNINKSNACLLK